VNSKSKNKPVLNQPTEIPKSEPDNSGSPADPQALASVMDFLDRTSNYQNSPVGIKTVGDGKTKDDSAPIHHQPNIETVIVPEGTPGSAPSGSANKVTTVSPAQANTQISLTEAAPGQPVAAPTVKSLRVRTSNSSTNSLSSNTTLNATNQGMEVQAADKADNPAALIASLSKKVRSEPSFENEWALRLTQAAVNDPVEIGSIGKGLPEEQRQVIANVAALLSAVRHEALNPQLPGEEALLRATDLTAQLAQRADPVITTIALCRRVVTFGVYEEMPASEFAAGRATPTIVYSEIRNLRSDKGADGLYRSVLATRMELFTADGQSVWQHEEPEITDLCRNRRGDFFVAQRVTLPATLKDGPHVLKVLVDDKLSGRAAEQSFRFSVHGGTAVAKSK